MTSPLTYNYKVYNLSICPTVILSYTIVTVVIAYTRNIQLYTTITSLALKL